MITAQHKIVDLFINNVPAEQLCTCVEISEQSLAVALYDKSALQFMGFESWLIAQKNSDDISSALSYSEILKMPVSEHFVNILLPTYTHIPLELFDEQVAGKYLDFALSDTFRGEIKFTKMLPQQAVCVFRIPKSCTQFFDKSGQNVLYSHFSTMFITKSVDAFGTQSDAVCIFIHQNSFELVAPIRGSFKLYNTYLFQSAQEFIYFLLLAMKQLGYNAETVNLNVSGGIDKDSPLMEILFRYVRNINPVMFTKNSATCKALENIPHNRYDMLFQQCLCS